MTELYEENLTDLIGGEKKPYAKFEKVGATVVGTVIEWSMFHRSDIASKELLYWNGGKPTSEKNDQPVMALRVLLDVDGVETNVFLDKKNLISAFKEAVAKAGGKLSKGSKLTIKYSGDGEKTNPAFNAPKLFKVKYEYIAPELAISDSEDEGW